METPLLLSVLDLDFKGLPRGPNKLLVWGPIITRSLKVKKICPQVGRMQRSSVT